MQGWTWKTLRCWTRFTRRVTSSNSAVGNDGLPDGTQLGDHCPQVGMGVALPIDGPVLRVSTMDGAAGLQRLQPCSRRYDDRPGDRGVAASVLERNTKPSSVAFMQMGSGRRRHAVGDFRLRVTRVGCVCERVLGGPNDHRWRWMHALSHPSRRLRIGLGSRASFPSCTRGLTACHFETCTGAGIAARSRPYSPRVCPCRPAGPVGHDPARDGLPGGGR